MLAVFAGLALRSMSVRATRSGAVLVLLVDGHGVEGLLLLGLGLDQLDERDQVGYIFLILGPLGLGQQLVGDGALHGAADAEDAVVAGFGVEAGKGSLHSLGLLGDQVIGAVKARKY